MPTPPEVQAYLSHIEQLRQEYLSFISDKDDNLLRACLGEMQDAKKAIEKRGFIQLRGDDLITAAIGGVNATHSFVLLKNIDFGLYSSAQKTIEFIQALIGKNTMEPATVVEPIEEEEQEEIIRGVKGLASFLGIGTTKAQAIINSKILTNTKPAVQYYAGAWMFNKKGLQDFINNNPDAFRNVKCPH